jgi:hypothetical protein
MWGPLTVGFWWIFPLMGLVMCLGCLLMMFRSVTTGRGFMCMRGHHGTQTDEDSEMRRELSALREEVSRLKAAR